MKKRVKKIRVENRDFTKFKSVLAKIVYWFLVAQTLFLLLLILFVVGGMVFAGTLPKIGRLDLYDLMVKKQMIFAVVFLFFLSGVLTVIFRKITKVKNVLEIEEELFDKTFNQPQAQEAIKAALKEKKLQKKLAKLNIKEEAKRLKELAKANKEAVKKAKQQLIESTAQTVEEDDEYLKQIRKKYF